MAFGLQRIAAGLASQAPRAILRGINEYLGEHGVPAIVSLDDITSDHTKYSIEKLLGYRTNSPQSMKRRLVELDVLPRDLRRYSPSRQEHIATAVLNDIHGGRPVSAYFTPRPDIGDLPAETLEQNRSMLVKRRAFKRFMEKRGFHTLDDISREAADRGVGTILGYEEGNPTQMKRRLVELGYFSVDLEKIPGSASRRRHQYERVARHIVREAQRSTPWKSSYTPESLDQDILTSNRSILAKTRAFHTYLAGIGITNLDDVVSENTHDLYSFGIEKGQAVLLKQRLAEWDVFPTRLRLYSTSERERIAQTIVDRLGANVWKSAYFSQDLAGDVLEDNRQLLLATVAATAFLGEPSECNREGVPKGPYRFFRKLGYAKEDATHLVLRT
jgi:hypothetical protein